MRNRGLTATGILAVTITLTTMVPAAGQAPARVPKPYAPARTPDGQPDLQGVWNIATITPLERPASLAEKQVLTDDEVASLDESARVRGDQVPKAGETGVFNAFWWDLGKTVPDKRTSLIVDPSDGKIPFTPDGLKRARAPRGLDSVEERSLWERCITRNGAPILPGGYNNNVQILQAPGYVVVLLEVVHDARIIPLDSRPHLGPQVSQWLGDSRGRWEGNTLVVDTADFSPRNGFQGAREGLHLVERFTRVDADTIRYEFTVDDPVTYTRAWTAVSVMRKDPGGRLYEYSCHEGNIGLAGILNGARVQERAAADAAKKGSR
jgi:hypothetical protein